MGFFYMWEFSFWGGGFVYSFSNSYVLLYGLATSHPNFPFPHFLLSGLLSRTYEYGKFDLFIKILQS